MSEQTFRAQTENWEDILGCLSTVLDAYMALAAHDKTKLRELESIKTRLLQEVKENQDLRCELATARAEGIQTKQQLEAESKVLFFSRA